MKKILFLILICVKLFSYNYVIYSKNVTTGLKEIIYFNDIDGLNIRRIYSNDYEDTGNYVSFYNSLDLLKRSLVPGYISNLEFKSFYKNDLNFLNDFYITNDVTRNSFFNYLYNDNIFSESNFIQYDNFELLYDSDGLVVESIVNGVWAGLYEDNEKNMSGNLYSSDGILLYHNGEEVDYFRVLVDKLLSKFDTTIVGVFWILGTVVMFGVFAYYVLDSLFFVVQIGRNVYTGLRYGRIDW